jgi:hypothetical protein
VAVKREFQMGGTGLGTKQIIHQNLPRTGWIREGIIWGSPGYPKSICGIRLRTLGNLGLEVGESTAVIGILVGTIGILVGWKQ